VLNDFTDQAEQDRLTFIERGNKMIRTLETQYRAVILKSLQDTFTVDRVRDLNIKIEMDLSKKAINTEEYFPVTIRPRTPGSSYDDSEIVPSVTRSKTTSSTSWKGTGFTPEGPSGVEGQTAPAFRDMSDIYGEVTQQTLTDNEEINKRSIQEERTPQIDRVTVSVNIDGTWRMKYDEKQNPVVLPDGTIEREYTPISTEDLRATQTWIQNAIGYNASRGDSVTVQNIGFDRSKQFADEDAAFFKQKQLQTIILIGLGGFVLLLIGFIVFRTLMRRLERKRMLEEAERTKREQEMRDSALMQAEQEGSELPMSNEDRVRMELHETVADVAKNHPEDVAQLLRTWLLEE
jgi:flagellar M-ring protein FliF